VCATGARGGFVGRNAEQLSHTRQFCNRIKLGNANPAANETSLSLSLSLSLISLSSLSSLICLSFSLARSLCQATGRCTYRPSVTC
jgi:hypothetical protein